MVRKPLASLLALLLCGCVVRTASPAAPVLTPRELNTHPEQYDGREVVVRGFVLLGTNARSLYQSKERFEQLDRAFQTPGFDPAEFNADCLTLIDAQIVEENRDVFEGRTITVRGRFERNYLNGQVLDLQACAEPTALALDERDTRRLLRALKHAH